MEQYQWKASQLTTAEKNEAMTIARRIFGVHSWQGMVNQVYGPAGMSAYINRAVIRKIKPQGANWLIGERPLNEVESVYFAKRI